eukprot:jgi/Picsp_1/1436/NSC_04915-R1_protein
MVFDLQLVAQFLSLLWNFCFNSIKLVILIPYFIIYNALISLGLSSNGAVISTQASTPDDVVFYRATVVHKRTVPVVHRFQYPVRVALIDLDRPPEWWRTRKEKQNDNISAEEARKLAGTQGRVKLLTNPPALGYIQNPISVYYCFSPDGTLEMCIAEVTNTPWADRVTFLFRPGGEEVPKSLHVSPLMDMQNVWRLRTVEPGKNLHLSVSVRHPEKGDYFFAVIRGSIDSKVPNLPNEEAGLSVLFKYGFQPQRIALWIYSHALVLLFKGVPFYGPPSLSTCQSAQNVAENPRVSGKDAFKWRPCTAWPWKSQ